MRISERPGTYRKTTATDAKEEGHLASQDQKQITPQGPGKSKGFGISGSKGGVQDSDELPKGDESLPWRKTSRKLSLSTQKQVITEQTTQQAQPWTEEKITLRKTTREKKEVSKEKIEDIQLKPSKPQQREIPKQELEHVDLKSFSKTKESVTESVDNLVLDKQTFTTDVSTLKLQQEDEAVIAKGWRKKKEKRATEETQTTTTDKIQSSTQKQIHTEDTTLLDISETEREDTTKSAQLKDWRKQRKEEDKTILKVTDKEITIEKKPTDKYLTKQVDTEDKTILQVSEKENDDVTKIAETKDWRKRRTQKTTKSDVEDVTTLQVEEKQIADDRQPTVPKVLQKPRKETIPAPEEVVPWNKEEIKLRKTPKIHKEITSEKLEEVTLKSPKRDDKDILKVEEVDTSKISEQQIIAEKQIHKVKPEESSLSMQHIEDRTLLKLDERESIDTKETLETRGWRKPRRQEVNKEKETQPEPKAASLIPQQNVEDTTLLKLEEKETVDSKEVLETKGWRKPRKNEEEAQQPKQETVPWNKEEITLKKTPKTRKEIPKEKLEEVTLKTPEKPTSDLTESTKIQPDIKAPALSTKQITEDKTLLKLEEKETSDDKQVLETKGWRKSHKKEEIQSEIEAPSLTPQKIVEDKALLKLEEKETVGSKEILKTKGWRKPHTKEDLKEKEQPEAQSLSTQQILDDKTLLKFEEKEAVDNKEVTETKGWRTSHKKEQEVQQPKLETVPWNKEEITLKKTPRTREGVPKEKLDEVILKTPQKQTSDIPQPQAPTMEEKEIQPKIRAPSLVTQQAAEDKTLLKLEKKETVDKEILETQGWRKPRKKEEIIEKQSDVEAPSLTTQHIVEDKALLKLQDKEIVQEKEMLETKGWRKPRKKEELQQPKQEEVPWNKEEIKLKKTPKEKKEVPKEKLEDVVLKQPEKPISDLTKPEKVVLQTQEIDEKVSATQPSKKPQKIKDETQDKPAELSQVEDTTLIKIEQITEEKPQVKGWRKPRKEEAKSVPTKPQVVQETTEEAVLTVEEKHVPEQVPAKQTQVEDSTIVQVDETKTEDATQAPETKSWRKPQKKPDKKEEPIPWNKQEIKLKKAQKISKDIPKDKLEEINLKPHINELVDLTETITEKAQTEEIKSLKLPEKPEEVPIEVKDWQRPRESERQPILTTEEPLQDKEIITPVQETKQETKIPEKVIPKLKPQAEQKEDVADSKKPEKVSEKPLPWTEEKVQLKKAKPLEKTLLTDDAEEIQLKPVLKTVKDTVTSDEITLKSVDRKDVKLEIEDSKQFTKDKLVKKSKKTKTNLEEIVQVSDTAILKVDDEKREETKQEIEVKSWRKQKPELKEGVTEQEVSETTEKLQIAEQPQEEIRVAESELPAEQEVPWQKQKLHLKKTRKEQKTAKEEKREEVDLKPIEQRQLQEETNEEVTQVQKDVDKKMKKKPSKAATQKVEQEEATELLPRAEESNYLPEQNELPVEHFAAMSEDVPVTVPWQEEKVVLKRTPKTKKEAPKKEELEVVLKPIEKKGKKDEVVVTKETAEDQIIEVKETEIPKQENQISPKTVIMEETVTEVEDTIVLKVDEGIEQTKPEETIEESKPSTPWRKSAKPKEIPASETVERVELKPVRRDIKPTEVDQETVKLKPISKITQEISEQVEKPKEDIPIKPYVPEASLDLEKYTPEVYDKPEFEKPEIQEEDKPQIPWRREKQVKQKEVPEDTKVLKIGKGKIPEDKIEKETVELKPIPKKTQPKEDKQLEVDVKYGRDDVKQPTESAPDIIGAVTQEFIEEKGDIPEAKPISKKETIPEKPTAREEVPWRKTPQPKNEKPELIPVQIQDDEVPSETTATFTKTVSEIKLSGKPEILEKAPLKKDEIKQEELTETKQEMTVKIASKKTPKEKRRVTYFDDTQPLPELEIISQKKTTEQIDKLPEESATENIDLIDKTVHRSVIEISKKQIKRPKPKPPKFVQRVEPVAVEKDKTARLVCKVEGTPFPEIAWYKNEVLLQASERVQIHISEDTVSLEFSKVTPQDVAIYSCKATNPAGVATSTANLVILGRIYVYIVCKCFSIKYN